MQIIRKIRHPSRDFTVPIVVAKIPIVVAIPGSDGGDCFHGSKKHSSLPPAAAHLLKGCNISLYHCFFLPYDGNDLYKEDSFCKEDSVCKEEDHQKKEYQEGDASWEDSLF